jgi:hypothetical protein
LRKLTQDAAFMKRRKNQYSSLPSVDIDLRSLRGRAERFPRGAGLQYPIHRLGDELA